MDLEKGQSLEISEKILQFIQNNPGCHLRKIKQTIRISQGTVQYHTDRLEKMGRITSTRNGLYIHYFRVGIDMEANVCDCIVVTRTANAVYSLAIFLLLVPWPMSHMPTTQKRNSLNH